MCDLPAYMSESCLCRSSPLLVGLWGLYVSDLLKIGPTCAIHPHLCVSSPVLWVISTHLWYMLLSVATPLHSTSFNLVCHGNYIPLFLLRSAICCKGVKSIIARWSHLCAQKQVILRGFVKYVWHAIIPILEQTSPTYAPDVPSWCPRETRLFQGCISALVVLQDSLSMTMSYISTMPRLHPIIYLWSEKIANHAIDNMIVDQVLILG